LARTTTVKGVFRFLLSARWLGFLLFVLVLAGVCTRLGFWQIHKLDARLDRNQVITKHFAAAPVDLTAALPAGQKVDDGTEWTRVTAVGTYDEQHQVTVKFTTRDGAPGADVVTPLVLASGDAVLVDRGWIATANNVTKPDVPAAPSGTVTVEGWLRQDNGAGDDAVKPVDGQVRAVSSIGMADSVPYDLRRGYLNLQKQVPSAGDALAVEPKPELGQGPHFFYALQWWFFALLAVVGYVWFARVEAKERRAPTRIDGFAQKPDVPVAP
jgi:cytochrome oxidase assembly protein ShyY1